MGKFLLNHVEIFEKLKRAGYYDKLAAKGMLRESNQTGLMYVYTMSNSNSRFRIKVIGFFGGKEYTFTGGPYVSICDAAIHAYELCCMIDDKAPVENIKAWFQEKVENPLMYVKSIDDITPVPHRKIEEVPEEDIKTEPEFTSDDYMLLLMENLDTLPIEKVLDYSEMFSNAVNARILKEVTFQKSLIDPEKKFTQKDMDAQREEILTSITKAVKGV